LQSNEVDTTSQGSAGGGAAAAAAAEAETEGDETMAVVAEAEAEEQMGSAEAEDHIQRILAAIDSYTRQVSEMLDAGRALFKDLAADFEERLCA
jgi:proline dehydrogenase